MSLETKTSAAKPFARRAVFLDRDGVLICAFVRDETPHPPQSLDDVEIISGVSEALARLRQHDFLLIVVTNQPDVARGTQTREVVEQINAHLRQRLALDAIYVCYHDNADRCACRKPAPGMLLTAAAEHGIDLAQSFMVGDRAGDIAAGNSAGCRTFLIEKPYSRCDPVKPTFKVADLREVANHILATSEVKQGG